MFTSNSAEVFAGPTERYKVPPRPRRRKHQYHSVTALPVIGSKVKPVIDYGGSRQHWATLALHLLNAGFLKSSDKGDVVSLCSVGLNRWMEQHTKPLKVYGMDIIVTPDISDEGYEYTDGGSKTEASRELFMRFTIDDSIAQFAIGEKLMRLEELVPGLGKTAYHWLAVQGVRHFGVFTPWMGHDLAQYTWWFGCDTMQDFEEELQNYEMTLEEFGQPTPDEWTAAFPEWALNINAELSAEQLQDLVSHKDALIGEVASAILDVQSLKDSEMPDLYGTELQAAYSGFYLFWEEQDMSTRLLDDFMEYANSGADYYTNDVGIVKIPREITAIAQLFQNLETGFKQMKNIERLTSLVGTQIN